MTLNNNGNKLPITSNITSVIDSLEFGDIREISLRT